MEFKERLAKELQTLNRLEQQVTALEWLLIFLPLIVLLVITVIF